MSEYKECFIQAKGPLNVGAGIQTRLYEAQSIWTSLAAARQPSPHLTLMYLGRQSLDEIKRVGEFLDRYKGLALNRKVGISGFGYFDANPLVLYLHAQVPKEIYQLRDLLEQEFPSVADRNLPFRPHITLAEVNIDSPAQRNDFERHRIQLSRLFTRYSNSFVIDGLVVSGRQKKYLEDLVKITGVEN